MERLREGAVRALPLAMPVLAVGVTFGAIATTLQMPVAAAVVMSATTFAGSAQFAVLGILAEGGAVAAAVTAAVLLNLRYLPIGVSAAPALSGQVLLRLLKAQLLVDESWAIGHVGGGRYDGGLIIGSGLVLFAGWVGGTAVGAVGAEVVGDPDALGLDVLIPVVFLGLLRGLLTDRPRWLVAGLAGVLTVALTPLVPPGLAVVASASVALLGLRREPG